jgi:hypothetical protein
MRMMMTKLENKVSQQLGDRSSRESIHMDLLD